MKKLFIVVLLYGFVVLLVFGGALWPGQNQLIFGDDIHHQYYFYREFFNHFLSQGIFPWWNPYNFSGTPFLADPILNIWYPMTWLFFFLPLNIAYPWHLALHIVFAMTGMYCALRAISNSKYQISNMSAWIGGLLFGLSGFFMARVWAGHVDVIAAASWMPIVIISNFKFQMANEKTWKKNFIIAAGVLAMQLLAGYHTMAFFTMEAVGLITLFFCYQQRSFVPAFRALFVLLLGIGLAAIQLVPEIELIRQSIRSYSLPYSWASYGSWMWESVKQLVNPFIFGNQFTYRGPPPNFSEHAAFIGTMGIGLAVLEVVVLCLRLFKSPKIFLTKTENLWGMIFTMIAIFGIWVSLGPNAPVDLQKILWTIVPLYHSLRIPPRHLILFVFGASALAGIGVHMILSRLSKVYFTIPVGMSKYTLHIRSAVGGVIACIVCIEMILFARHFIELRPIPEIRQDDKLIAVLKQDTQSYRLLQNFGVWVSPQREALEFDATMSKGIFSATGYDIAILKSYYEFIDAANGNRGSSILQHDVQVPYITKFTPWVDFLNIKYIMVPRAFDPLYGTGNDRFILICDDSKYDYRLYENKTVLPRFFFVSDIRVVSTKDDVLTNIRDGSINPHATVIFEKASKTPPSLFPCKATTDSSVIITSYTPNRIELITKNSCDAYLVSSEVYYPGWTAYIDGKKTDILKGNYAFRTLFVPAGTHTILYQYIPNIFVAGVAITVISSMASILLLKYCNWFGSSITRL